MTAFGDGTSFVAQPIEPELPDGTAAGELLCEQLPGEGGHGGVWRDNGGCLDRDVATCINTEGGKECKWASC